MIGRPEEAWAASNQAMQIFTDSANLHFIRAQILVAMGNLKQAEHEYQITLTLEPNDVTCTGIEHKLGYKGCPACQLAMGDNGDCRGYLVGQPHQGLSYMFQMMNEERVNVGMGAVAKATAAYYASLEYSKDRRQNRKLTDKNPESPQVPIIEHADVKRMLLAQKAYCEGALALVLYCARLVDDRRTGDEVQARTAAALLAVLTPVAKSWPSEWCLAANDLAIQVHGGYGYTRDFPVEQYWRDNRLNMIHEGTHGIQAADLLGRKVTMEGGKGLSLVAARINRTTSVSRKPSESVGWRAGARAAARLPRGRGDGRVMKVCLAYT
jgi:butyryl-CoA dehydrogenase